jgi:hypothetical protein
LSEYSNATSLAAAMSSPRVVSILFALRLFIVLTDPFSGFADKTALLATVFRISSILGLARAIQASFV